MLPPVAVSPRKERELVPTSIEETILDLAVNVRCIEDDGATATLTVEIPEGWTVDPRGHLELDPDEVRGRCVST